MSREEAIEVLGKMKYPQKVNKNGFIITNVNIENEALEMAIQALSQEPCRYWQNGKCNGNTEVCDDAISREDAEQMFRNIRSHLKPQDYKSAEEFNTRDLMLLNAEQMIHALPSVTQKSGKWIKMDEGFSPYECSVCGSIEFKKSKYCPNCGARMESEDKE